MRHTENRNHLALWRAQLRPTKADAPTQANGRHNVLVYGTLMGGYSNHGTMHNGEATRVGFGRTSESTYTMTAPTSGGFPIVHPYDAEIDEGSTPSPIFGEVWEVDDRSLLHCDALEGHPHWYCRRVVTVDLMSDRGNLLRSVPAWTYVMSNDQRHEGWGRVESGYWPDSLPKERRLSELRSMFGGE